MPKLLNMWQWAATSPLAHNGTLSFLSRLAKETREKGLNADGIHAASKLPYFQLTD